MVSFIDLYDFPTLTIEHGDSVDLIATITCDLKQCSLTFLQLLHDRATAFASCAQFDLAHRDARAMQLVDPTLPLSYLSGGNIFRMQGHQQAAIDMYEEGLRSVPWDDPGYIMLENARQEAKYMNSKRVDFISLLPLDVVITNIVPRIMEHGSSLLQQVCKTWKERMLLASSQDPSTTLHIEEPLPVQASLLLKRLEAVSSTLNHLTLHFAKGARPTTPLFLYEILLSCPNLSYLDAECLDVSINTTTTTTTSTQPAVYPAMKILHIYDTSYPIAAYAMNTILTRFPSLISLTVHPCRSSSPLTNVYQLCPRLQSLVYVGDDTFIYPAHHDDYNIAAENDTIGIRALSIGGRNGIFSQDDVVHTLLQHSKSLESLYIDASFSSPDILLGIIEHQDVVFACLKELRLFISGNDHDILRLTRWILQHAPFLEYVELGCSSAHRSLLDTTISLPHLSRIVLYLDSLGSSVKSMIEEKLPNVTCIVDQR